MLILRLLKLFFVILKGKLIEKSIIKEKTSYLLKNI